MMQTEETTTANGGDLKRDRSQMSVTKLPSASDAVAVPPPLKKMKSTPMMNFMSSLQAGVGSAPTFEQLSRGGSGADCYGIVVNEWKGKSYPTSKDSTFKVTTVGVILSAFDPSKGMLIDESTNELVFDLPDPDVLKVAMELKKKNKTTERIIIKERLEHRVALDQVQRIKIIDITELKDVPFPAIVYIEGFRCKARRDKSGKMWFDLNASSVTPVACTTLDASKMIEYVKKCGALSSWHHEEAYATEAELAGKDAGGKRTLVVRAIRLDDEPGIADQYSMSHEKGFVAAVRVDNHGTGNFFYYPKDAGAAFDKLHETDPVKPVKPDPKFACLDECQDFGIRAIWPLTVTQWDTAKNPNMGINNALVYDISVKVYGKALWWAGLSHPRHWIIFSPHTRYMDGILMCQEARKATGEVKHNIGRAMAIKGFGRGNISMGGAGTKQYTNVWSRGVMMDVAGYLRKYALSCGFETASILMGAEPGDAASNRKLALAGIIGHEKDREGKDVALDFRPNNFVCLNATQQYRNLRTLNERVDRYYVLTCLIPEGHANLAKMEALAPRIKDAQVLEICQSACRNHNVNETFKKASKETGASDSFKAAGEWLSLCALSDIAHKKPAVGEDEEPPYLVFATFKPSSAEIEDRQAKEMELACRAWTKGPAGAIEQGRAVIRLNAPAQDELDLMIPVVNGGGGGVDTETTTTSTVAAADANDVVMSDDASEGESHSESEDDDDSDGA